MKAAQLQWSERTLRLTYRDWITASCNLQQDDGITGKFTYRKYQLICICLSHCGDSAKTVLFWLRVKARKTDGGLQGTEVSK